MSKKLVTLLLTLSLVLSASAPAFAAAPADAAVSSSETTEVTAGTTENPAASIGSSETSGPSESSETTGSAESSEPSESPTPSESSDPSTSSDPSDPSTSSDPAKSEADSTDKDQQESTEVEKDKAEQAKKEKADAEKKAAAKKAQRYRDGLASYIRSKNPSLSKSWSKTLAGYFIDAGKKYDLDPTILMAIAQRESTFRAKATSPYGIKGMMQTSDALARRYGYKPSSLYKAKVSIDVGARYLSSAKKKFGTYTKALSAYVYGSYAVSKGSYSTSHAKSMLKIRRNIKTYLKKYDFV